MSQFIDFLYTVFTRIMDFLSWSWDLLNDGITFVTTSFNWFSGLVLHLPAAVQGTFLLALVLGCLCLFFNR